MDCAQVVELELQVQVQWWSLAYLVAIIWFASRAACYGIYITIAAHSTKVSSL